MSRAISCEKNTLATPVNISQSSKSGCSDRSYHFIVITACEKRRKEMEKQFNALGVQLDVHYLDASTPQNSESYFGLDLQDISQQKIMCCCRSHIRAMDYGSKSRFRYSIIVEDDVCFLKDGFIEAIEGIIENWDECSKIQPVGRRERLLVSIGWIPTRNYSIYSNICRKEKNHPPVDVFPILASGTQAYIIRDVTHNLNLDTYLDYMESIRNNFLTKDYTESECRIADVVLTGGLFNQMIAFPPLAIETGAPSLLGHQQEPYWDVYFKDFESERNRYLLDP